MFRPLLWSFRFDDLDVEEDRDDIIMNTINEGGLRHWRWIIQTYGKNEVSRVLAKHLESEFHPESRNLAQLVFSVPTLRHAR